MELHVFSKCRDSDTTYACLTASHASLTVQRQGLPLKLTHVRLPDTVSWATQLATLTVVMASSDPTILDIDLLFKLDVVRHWYSLQKRTKCHRSSRYY